jgi:hypothetical protein
MGDELSFSMSLPLDYDGFLRRECPNCEREFMALYAEDDSQETPPEPGGYYCPYCALQAGADDWWTRDQLAQARSVVVDEFVDPMLRKFGRDLERSGGGFLTVSTETSSEEVPDALAEGGDMIRVGFVCHPRDPLKVLASWDRGVHCTVCGMVVEP